MKTIKLDKWAVVAGGNYTTSFIPPPEIVKHRLSGYVYGHPKIPDGEHITSSYIVSCSKKGNSRLVETHSGSVYRLGRIAPAYRNYLKRTRPEWNWRKPITMH